MSQWRQEKLELAKALFYVCKPTHLLENSSQASQNSELVCKLSKRIAAANRPHFKKKLAEKLPQLRKYIKETDEPLVDCFGRATHFYVVVGGQALPVYAPGAIMFDSAVRDGPAAVHHGGSQ